MSATLWMTIKYEDGKRRIGGAKILKAASLMLKILNSIDCNITTKKRPSILWDVDITSAPGQAVIRFTAFSRAELAYDVAGVAEKNPPKVPDR